MTLYQVFSKYDPGLRMPPPWSLQDFHRNIFENFLQNYKNFSFDIWSTLNDFKNVTVMLIVLFQELMDEFLWKYTKYNHIEIKLGQKILKIRLCN